MSTTVLLADDDRLVRTGLRAILDHEPDLAVVGEAENGEEAVERAANLHPDVVLMDVRMPGTDGLEATRRLVERDPERPRVLVVTTFENDAYVYDALRVGASGFVLKRVDPSELVNAVRIAASGESLVFPALTRRLVERFGPRNADGDRAALLLAGLTDREAEILRLVAAGHSNADIAAGLFLSHQTVKTHVSNVLTKLQTRDRTQAVIAAYEGGLVVPGGNTTSARSTLKPP